jgi:AraC-like DNA-binding protein
MNPTTIPLIRAGSLAPLIKWLERLGRPVAGLLSAAGISPDPVSEPDRLIPMRAVGNLFRDVAAAENCPDLCWRIIREMSVADLGRYGLLIASERTTEDALRKASLAMPHFCSHERLDFIEGPDHCLIRSCFLIRLDPETLHQAQIHTLALIRTLLGASGRTERLFSSISLPPHPVHGFSHLPSDIIRVATPALDGVLTMTIERSVLQRPLSPRLMQARPYPATEAWERLPGADVGFVEVIRNLIAESLPDGTPSAERMAANAGVTLRTLQRRLAVHGTTFRALVEETRRSVAVDRLSAGQEAIGDIATRLGYSSPASLSRAVRKWTDQSPTGLRKGRVTGTGRDSRSREPLQKP